MIYEENEGNDHEVVECLRDAIAISTAMSRHRPTYYNAEESLSDLALSVNMVFAVDASIEIESNGDTLGTKATEAQIRALIADLLDESSFRDATERSWKGDAAFSG